MCVRRIRACKYELIASGEQQRDICRFAGSCRFVFNKALALQTANHAAGGKFIRYVEMANMLPMWKSEFAWLRESPSQALQQALKNLDRAFVNFFQKRTEYPRFKKRGRGDSFRFPQGFKLDQANDRILLPKLGWLRYRSSREVVGYGQQYHRQQPQMVGVVADRTGRRTACRASRCRRRRPGYRSLRHAFGWNRLPSAQHLQAVCCRAAQSPAGYEP